MSIGLRRNPLLWGSLITPTSSTGGTSLSAAATWVAFSFFLDRDRTLNKLRASVTKTGSPIAADLQAELYSTNSSGNPNTSLGTFSAPSGTSGVIEWAGLSVALTAHTMYFIVFKNVNASPASNSYSVNSLNADPAWEFAAGSLSGSSLGFGWGTRRTTNSGSTWVTDQATTMGMRLEFADGYFEGWGSWTLGTAAQVFSNRETGIKFVAPDLNMAIRGITFPVFRTATPTGDLRYRLYVSDPPVLLATTNVLPNAAVVTLTSTAPGIWLPLFFSSTVAVPANSIVRAVISETTQSDTSGNRLNHRRYAVDNDADSKALCGNFYGTLSTDGGASFADTDTETGPFALILESETSGSFVAPPLSAARRSLNGSLLRYRRGML